MAQDITVPDAGPIHELLQAFRASKVMFAAVSLGVFDALAAGPQPLAALAETLHVNADALERLHPRYPKPKADLSDIVVE